MSQFYHSQSPSIPLHAAYIWAEGEAIRLAIDGTVVTLPKLGHKVEVRGKVWSKLELALWRILQGRECETDQRIGTAPHPTQAQVPSLAKEVADAWLKDDKEKKAEAKRQAEAADRAERAEKATKFLEEIGL